MRTHLVVVVVVTVLIIMVVVVVVVHIRHMLIFEEKNSHINLQK